MYIEEAHLRDLLAQLKGELGSSPMAWQGLLRLAEVLRERLSSSSSCSGNVGILDNPRTALGVRREEPWWIRRPCTLVSWQPSSRSTSGTQAIP